MTFEYNSPDLVFSNTLNMNLFRFHVAKTKEDAILVNKLFRESKSFSKFKASLFEHLQTIDVETLHKEYNYAANACSAASDYQRFIEKNKLFPFWKINIIKDCEYPNEINFLDNIVLPATCNAWNYIYPPNFLGDTSYITVKMDFEVKDIDHASMNERLQKFLLSDFWKKCTNNGFGINRAIESLVKEENERYLRLLE